MAGNGIVLSPEQCRMLFYNLRVDFKDIFQSISPEDDEEGWADAESELRRVFEMTRFGLTVPGIDNSDELEVFKNHCEDVDGIEPLDWDLVDEIGKVCDDISDATLVSANYRQTLPTTILNHFESYKQAQRKLISEVDQRSKALQQQRLTERKNEPAPATQDTPPIDEIVQATELLRQSLSESKRKLSAVTKLN